MIKCRIANAPKCVCNTAFFLWSKNMAGDGAGMYRSTFSDGTPQFEIEYSQGKLNGIMRRYAQNGQILLECTYADDVKEGRCKRWHANGFPAEESFYIDDKLEGEFTQFDEKGNVILKTRFRDGNIVQPDAAK